MFSVFACNFECYPNHGSAFLSLSPLINSLDKLSFTFKVNDPTKNQGQLTSDFDTRLENGLIALGVQPTVITLGGNIPQRMDFAFSYKDKKVAVEIEKANREKILRDLLKCHMYLSATADFALLFLPRNYPHKLGVWDLFAFGKDRYEECLRYGFGKPEIFQQIMLVGFTQCESASGKIITAGARELMREHASGKPIEP